jgi:hypothetical protein
VLSARRVALVGAVAGAPLLGRAPAARADVPVSQVGWWTRSPSPPTVPEGGSSVGAAPDGDLTVGAVLVDTGGGASGSSLRLVESSGGAGAEVAALQVCPTSATWAAEAGGAMADAPDGQCDAASVEMVRGADGTWTGDVQSLLEGKTGEVGLLVRPATGSVAFQLSFAPPTVTGSVTDATSSTGSQSTATTTAPSTSQSEGGANTFSPPATTSYVAPPSATPTTVASSTQQVASAPGVDSSATAEAVEFTPLSGQVPAGESDADVGAVTVVLWYVLALVVGGAVAGLVWLRNTGGLSPATLLAKVRR